MGEMGIFRFKYNSQGRKGSETPNEEALYCLWCNNWCILYEKLVAGYIFCGNLLL